MRTAYQWREKSASLGERTGTRGERRKRGELSSIRVRVVKKTDPAPHLYKGLEGEEKSSVKFKTI